MSQTEIESKKGIPPIVGFGLIAVGISVLVDQFLKTGWIVFAIVPITGVIMLTEGMRTRKIGLIIPGSLVLGLSIGGIVFLSHLINLPVEKKVGLLIFFFAFGWIMIPVFQRVAGGHGLTWALVPGGIIASIGLCFLFSQLLFVDFVLYLVTGVGLVLLLWGIYRRLFGLIIPGCLLTTIGPGIYFAWGTSLATNALTKTGMMLVVFSLGWGLLILFGRMLTARFVWWPLIPGGIFAVVGWGLYIGGDPGNAMSFIANTGSIGLIIFGLYLLLMRKSIHR
jgi:hypothetical protein